MYFVSRIFFLKSGENTLDFFGWLRLPLPVSDGHWTRKGGCDRRPDRRFTSDRTGCHELNVQRSDRPSEEAAFIRILSVNFFNILSNKKIISKFLSSNNFDAPSPLQVLNLNVLPLTSRADALFLSPCPSFPPPSPSMNDIPHIQERKTCMPCRSVPSPPPSLYLYLSSPPYL